jgi:hypothetical protein
MIAPACPSHAGHRFPAEVIGPAVRLYFRFLLQPAQCGWDPRRLRRAGQHEAVRQWALKFGQGLADQIRRRLPRAGGTWHLDEVAATMAGWPMRPASAAGSEVLFITGDAENAVVGNGRLDRLCNLISGNSAWMGSRIPVIEGDVDAI